MKLRIWESRWQSLAWFCQARAGSRGNHNTVETSTRSEKKRPDGEVEVIGQMIESCRAYPPDAYTAAPCEDSLIRLVDRASGWLSSRSGLLSPREGK
jgi:hypothetical protein